MWPICRESRRLNHPLGTEIRRRRRTHLEVGSGVQQCHGGIMCVPFLPRAHCRNPATRNVRSRFNAAATSNLLGTTKSPEYRSSTAATPRAATLAS